MLFNYAILYPIKAVKARILNNASMVDRLGIPVLQTIAFFKKKMYLLIAFSLSSTGIFNYY